MKTLENKINKILKAPPLIATGTYILFKLLSPIEANAHTINGNVYDPWFNEPASNQTVTFKDKSTETDQDGNFTLNDVEGQDTLIVTDNLTNFSNYKGFLDVSNDTSLIIPMVRLLELDPRSEFEDYLTKFKYLTGTDGAFPHTWVCRWNIVPMRTFVPDFTNTHGFDYDSLVKNFAIADIETKTNLNLFRIADSDSAYGIAFDFTDNNSHTHFTWDGTNPQHCISYVKNNWGVEHYIKIDMQHELCWALCFKRMSTDDFDVSHGGYGMDGFSSDEAKIVRMMYSLPFKTDMAKYTNKPLGIEENEENIKNLIINPFANPFSELNIKYKKPNDGLIMFDIYNLAGQNIYHESDRKQKGEHSFKWDGKIKNIYAPSGPYFLRVTNYNEEDNTYEQEKRKFILVN